MGASDVGYEHAALDESRCPLYPVDARPPELGPLQALGRGKDWLVGVPMTRLCVLGVEHLLLKAGCRLRSVRWENSTYSAKKYSSVSAAIGTFTARLPE